MKCAFTGHRYERFPWGENEEDGRFLRLRERLRNEILTAIYEGYDYFIVGGATGVDTWAGEIVLELKEEGYVIFLEMAIPFAKHHAHLQGLWKERYQRLKEKADKITIVTENVSPKAAYHMRNTYMLKQAQKLIAVYEEQTQIKGGTYSTIEKAKKMNLTLVVIPYL